MGKFSLVAKVWTSLFIGMVMLMLTICEPTGAQAAQPAAIDTQPPSAPSGLTASNRTYTAISLTWNEARDNTGVRGYQIYRDGRKLITTSKTVYTNTELIPGREYTYVIKAYDAAGNVSEGSTPLKTETAADNQPPSVPGGLAVASNTYATITLTWKPSTDNISVKGYEIYCNGGRKASTTSTSYICKGFTPGKVYSFYIKAYDLAGNYSAQSAGISGCTVEDREAPTVPNGLKLQSAAETELQLGWSPSSDNVSVKGYEIFSDGKKVASASSPSCRVRGLIPGESHLFTVRALDSSGNASASSGQLKAASLKDTAAPSAPAGLTVTKTSGSSVSLKWDASADNVKVKGYYVYCNGMIVATSTKNSRTVKGMKGLGINIYWVKAYDLVGNLSPESNAITVLF